MDQTLNTPSYPESKYDNLRAAAEGLEALAKADDDDEIERCACSS